jgi:antitoxin (DNA-binding transcriptional repressor) of toxin-antitoxin stability system
MQRCGVQMDRMKKASVQDLRRDFKKLERALDRGEEIQITQCGRVIARLVPERARRTTKVPDFLARLRSIYGEKRLAVSGAELVAESRSRY